MAKPKPAKAAQAESLLVELLTEELPPKSLQRLSTAFATSLEEQLRDKDFLTPESVRVEFATPRRLAVRISNVRDRQLDRVVERKGPSVQAALDDKDTPTAALLGFARSCGVDVARLARRKDDKGEYFVYQSKQKGEPLARHLAGLVETAAKRLPVAKVMRWGAGEAQFVRPVHRVLMLHGAKVISGSVLDIKAGNKTLGHRFLSKGDIVIKRAVDYETTLRARGKVIASFEERRTLIAKQLRDAAKRQRAHVFLPPNWPGPEIVSDDTIRQRQTIARSVIQANEELLDEVTAIVEWPVVYAGEFEPEFLAVPPQCISLSMQKNQKYFALFSGEAEFMAKYLLVSNLETKTPQSIIEGNARVLRSRLADARFFYEQDKKTKLADRVPRLAQVVYHNKLGTQLERAQRLQKLAGDIAAKLGLDAAAVGHAERAAYLCKADLLTDMVGEFPELQGVMGYYYALHDGEPAVVANAIARHYAPRFANDALPPQPTDKCVALADKLDVLIGIFGIGMTPTGDKDPFGLRRAAVGVLRILIEQQLPLDLKELLERARAVYTQISMPPNLTQQVLDFFFDRLRPYLRDKGYGVDEIEAVLALKLTRLDQLPARLEAIKRFRALPEGMALAAANKRIRNILRQAGNVKTIEIDVSLLHEQAEQQLAGAVQSAIDEVTPLLDNGDYAQTLQRLAQLRPAVDEFFDRVMVMVDDGAVRNNRLALLNHLGNLFLRVADVSRLQS